MPQTEPWNSFPPDRVFAAMMPPVERPYSGRYPPVSTETAPWLVVGGLAAGAAYVIAKLIA